jgi:hypothetical protein
MMTPTTSTIQPIPMNRRSLADNDKANVERAFRRALAENLMAYPLTDGRWQCKSYALNIKGPAPLDVECECADAVYRERLCKHAACVVFCRLYGFVPCPPLGTDGQSRLPGCVEDFTARLIEQSGSVAA